MFWANILGLSLLVSVVAFACVVATMAGEVIYVDGLQAGVQLGEGREPESWTLSRGGREEVSEEL